MTLQNRECFAADQGPKKAWEWRKFTRTFARTIGNNSRAPHSEIPKLGRSKRGRTQKHANERK